VSDLAVLLVPLLFLAAMALIVHVVDFLEKYEVLRKSVAELKRRSDDAGDFRRALLEEAKDTLRDIREGNER